MDEWNHWRFFINSGSVLDYLAYKRAKETENTVYPMGPMTIS